MAEGKKSRPAIFTIPAHRAFADSVAIGLLEQCGKTPEALARGAVLVSNSRSARALTEAFVRHADSGGGKGLLLPRMVPVGDPELDERLGTLLDPLDGEKEIPPAIDPIRRQMILARLVQNARLMAGQPVDAGEAIRLAQALAATLDQMLIEKLSPSALKELDTGDLSHHWQRSLDMFELLLEAWPKELAQRGLIDLADRRNRLLAATSRRWKEKPPIGFVVAAGISTPAPAVAELLKTVSRLPNGQVVLADLDRNLTDEEWAAIGPFDADPITGRKRRGHETHPQYALKLLLDGMDVARSEVDIWKWGSEHDAGPQRSRNISNAMLVPRQTLKWRDLKPGDRSLKGVTMLEGASSAEEAQAVALALREVLETPGRTAALVTPNRDFAARVSAHLKRWGIEAEDSAGRPLAELPPGTLLLALAEAAAEKFAPVPLLALLKHPLASRGDRLEWLDHVRALDLKLRGPRPSAGLAGIDGLLGDDSWWREQVCPILTPLEDAYGRDRIELPALLAALREAASALSGNAVWAGYQGHQAARLIADIESAAHLGPDSIDPQGFSGVLDHYLGAQAVRLPQGGHPRVTILGLLESRLQQYDLMILSGLNEGSWPPIPAPDPWLAPRIRQELGLPSLERRIGLAAHDLANGLGAPQVLITRSRRDASVPAVASRFWLRLQAMAGKHWRPAEGLVEWARALDEPAAFNPAKRPHPAPPAADRPRAISVTEVDRLKADPYAFYARRYLGLMKLDPVDADPSAAWRGTAVHTLLEQWSKEDGRTPEALFARAEAMLGEAAVHPLMRALWQPRLREALHWVAQAVEEDRQAGRTIALAEERGEAEVAGVRLSGKADRIDTLADGTLAVVDFKTGKPPSDKQVAAGFSLQLGLLGLIAERGGFPKIPAGRIARAFEYWSLQRRQRGDPGFGYRQSPVQPGGGKKMAAEEFVGFSASEFAGAAAKWLTGGEPFTAKLVPEIETYDDYDQLMRLEEWYGRGGASGQ